jgi:hypothetical protein
MDTQHDEAKPQDGGPPPPSTDPADNGALMTGWLTRAEVAAQLGVNTDTLQRWDNLRIGPPTVRLGRKVYYRAEAFRAWLISRERGAPEGAGASRRVRGRR